MSKFILKVKTKSGQHIIDSANLTNTILELKQQISHIVNIQVNSMTILIGYPPKPIDNGSINKTLEDVNIKSGDTLIVEECAMSPSAPVKSFSPSIRHHIQEDRLDGGLLMRQVVPADNSCLFTSVGFVLGGKIDTTAGSYMRQIIAEQVACDEDQYSEGILGKPNKDYCQWILKPESWGGAIELAVLSNFYGIEIAVIDTMNGVINRFGEDKNYDYRVFLIFDGIHYDPLYREPIEAKGRVLPPWHINDITEVGVIKSARSFFEYKLNDLQIDQLFGCQILDVLDSMIRRQYNINVKYHPEINQCIIDSVYKLRHPKYLTRPPSHEDRKTILSYFINLVRINNRATLREEQYHRETEATRFTLRNLLDMQDDLELNENSSWLAKNVREYEPIFINPRREERKINNGVYEFEETYRSTEFNHSTNIEKTQHILWKTITNH